MGAPTIGTARRRWLRFGVSAGLLMIAAALTAAFVVRESRRAGLQSRAVALVRSSGGKVTVDDPWAVGGRFGGAVVRWLRAGLGVEVFCDVTGVEWEKYDYPYTPMEIGLADDQLAPLDAFDRLESLAILTAPKLTDAGLAHVSGRTGLRHLTLSRLNVGDAGLARLEGLTKLCTLGLVDLPITAAGLTHLRRMTDLRVLSLNGPFIGDVALAKLPALPKLKRLILLSTQTTGDGIATLGRFPALRELYLSGLNSSDVALARLTAVPTLQYLYLAGPEVTDAGLAHLAALKDLRSLDLDETNVTTAGLARLKAALPSLKVTTIEAARRKSSATD